MTTCKFNLNLFCNDFQNEERGKIITLGFYFLVTKKKKAYTKNNNALY